MTSNDGELPVVDVDQVFPLLTTDSATRPGRPSAADEDQAPAVAAVLRDVLGWRPRTQDPKAFLAALTASFRLKEVEGHVESEYVPRGFAIQADLGAVSGGQASLYSRARTALDQIVRLLDSLVPLRPDADPDDCAAFRMLVRHGVSRVVEELGNPGGPRQALVDSALTVLAGSRMASGPNTTADTVPGQLGALRDRFGLVDANVNTVDDETVRTAFWTLVDQILDLRRAWDNWKAYLAAGTSSGFLGTDLVLISRLMAAAVEQADELEAVLDSALVTAAERQTLSLPSDAGLTLDGLLSWLRRFLTEDGPMYARDSGRDGMRTAFAPTAQQLAKAVQTNLVDPLRGLGKDAGTASVAPGGSPVVLLLPTSSANRYPPGMYSARVRVAVAGLRRTVCDLFERAAQISRYPGAVLFDVVFRPVSGVSGAADGQLHMQVSVRGTNIRPTYFPVLVRGSSGDQLDLLRPLPDSASADGDTTVGLFRLHDSDTYLPPEIRAAEGRSVLLPAAAVPLALVDGETDDVVTAPPTLAWPRLERLPTAIPPTAGSYDWSGVTGEQHFTTTFASSTPEPDSGPMAPFAPAPAALTARSANARRNAKSRPSRSTTK